MSNSLLQILESMPGWCSLSKAQRMQELIKKHKPSVAVEIGVYGGRSLIAQALAMKEVGGVIYGVDPWSRAEAFQVDIDNSIVPEQAEFDALFENLNDIIAKHDLTGTVKLLRMTAKRAVTEIKGPIDFLHIDGNHGKEAVLEDVKNYFPLVSSGGIIWFDDADWGTVQPGMLLAKYLGGVELERPDTHNAVFTKP